MDFIGMVRRIYWAVREGVLSRSAWKRRIRYYTQAREFLLLEISIRKVIERKINTADVKNEIADGSSSDRATLAHESTNERLKTVTMLVVSDLRVDPRVERAARTVARAGYLVTVICPRLPNFRDWEIDWGGGIRVVSVPYTYALYSFPYIYDDALYRAAVATRPDIIHCHDLNTAIPGLRAASETGAHCVCDFHEWYLENVTWSRFGKRYVRHGWATRRVFEQAERLAVNQADAVITVCQSLATAIGRHYGSARPIEVIRNIPTYQFDPTRTKEEPGLRENLGLHEDTFLVLYQGGVGPSRYLEPIIEAMPYAPAAVLVIRGPSIETYGPIYRNLAERCGVADRVFCLPPVPSSEVVAAAREADVGIWTLPNICLNFYYALPNKIFEYLAAGLPILVANYPEAVRIAEGEEVGLSFDPDDPRSIAEQINRLQGDRAYYQRLRDNVPKVIARYDADEEWRKLVALYETLTAPDTGHDRAVAPASAGASSPRRYPH